jgi:hypothetical protein
VSFIAFDGIQGRMVITGYKGVVGVAARAVSFWIRTTQLSRATICWWGDDLTGDINNGEQNHIRLKAGGVELFGRGSRRKSASVVNDGSFHHILINYTKAMAALGHEDFGVANIYVDNVLNNGASFGGTKLEIQADGSQVTSLTVDTPSEEDVVIGARPDGTGSFTDFFDGDLDDFAIYNDVLTVSTINDIYNGGTPGIDLLSLDQTPSLQVWYRMGDGVGDTAPGTILDQSNLTVGGRNATATAGTSIV